MCSLFKSTPATAEQPARPAPITKLVNTPAKQMLWLMVAVSFIAPWEGFYPRAYRDEVGVKTICYGQTAADGADFSKVYTKDECEQMLGRDLEKYDEDLRRLLKPEVYAALSPTRHAALVSFDYNLGPGNTAQIAPYFNKGNWQAGCHAMLAYNHAGGKVLLGLTRRRQAEYQLCMKQTAAS